VLNISFRVFPSKNTRACVALAIGGPLGAREAEQQDQIYLPGLPRRTPGRSPMPCSFAGCVTVMVTSCPCWASDVHQLLTGNLFPANRFS
jgi:hypothetical protein